MERLNGAVKILEKSIENSEIPGAVAWVTFKGKTVLKRAIGHAHETLKLPMRVDTVFDVASLTKVCATLPSIMKLLEWGEISLEDPVSNYLPQFQNGSKNIKIKHLLIHTSGLPPSIHFHKKAYSLEQAVDEICHLPITVKPDSKVIYSDLNFILLGIIVQRISNIGLDVFSKQHIYEPLEMKNTTFNPSVSIKKNIAATEFDKEADDFLWGVVHDENTRSFGGVSGHAGLFSTAQDLGNYAQCLLNGGLFKEKSMFSPFTIHMTCRNYTQGIGENRGIGWQLPGRDDSLVGDIFPRTGFGHTGFTGTSLWLDHQSQLAVILLTNRVHYGRTNHLKRIRQLFHNSVVSSIVN